MLQVKYHGVHTDFLPLHYKLENKKNMIFVNNGTNLSTENKRKIRGYTSKYM